MPGALPRQHHILPAFYLAGFSSTGTADGELFVFDYPRNRRYQSSPRQVCRERDYFRVYHPAADDAYVLERHIAQVENRYAPILREIIAAGRLTDREHPRRMLELVAFIQSRSRRTRHNLGIGLAVTLRGQLSSGEVTPEQWESIRAEELAAGANPEDYPPYDEMRGRVVRGSWTPRPPRAPQAILTGHAQDAIFDVIITRDWELMATDGAANGGFITSDSPLAWGPVPENNATSVRTSLGDPDIEVTFPLSKNLALVSYPGARRANCTATDGVVAHVNTRTHMLSMGTIFHATEDFLLERAGQRVSHATEYFEYVRRAREAGIIRP